MQLLPDNTTVCRSTYDLSQAQQREALPGTFQSTGVWEGNCSGGKGAGREGAVANEGMTLILMTAHVPWSSASQSSYPLLSRGPLSHSPSLALTQASLQSPFLLRSSSGVVGGTCIPWYVGRGQETNSRSWPFPSIMWVPGWDLGLLTHLTKLAFDLPSFF
jgi:hypothetical protein